MINQEDILSITGKKKKKKLNTKSSVSDESQKSESGDGKLIQSLKKKKKKKLISPEPGEVPSIKKKKPVSSEGDEISYVKKRKKKKKLISPEPVEVPSIKKKKKKKKLISHETTVPVKEKTLISPDGKGLLHKKKKKKKLISPETTVPVREKILISPDGKGLLHKKKKKKKLISPEATVPVKEKKLISLDGEEILPEKKKKKKTVSTESVSGFSVKKKKKKKPVFSVELKDEVFDDLIIQSDREEAVDFTGESGDFFSPFSPKEEESFPIELLDMLADEDEPPPEIDEDLIQRSGFFGVSPKTPDKIEEEPELETLPQFFLEVTDQEEEEVFMQPEKNIEELLKESYGEIKDFVEVLPNDDLRSTFKPPCEPLPAEKTPDENDKKIIVIKKKKKLKK